MPVVVAEFAGAPRTSGAPPRRPEVSLVLPGSYCLDGDIRQEKLMDRGRGRELAARGGDAIVLVGSDDVTVDLRGHTVSNAREPGYTLVRQDRYVPGRRQSHWFTATTVRNGRLISPGSAGIGLRLLSANRYGPGGFGEAAALAPGQRPTDVFAGTHHLVENLVIDAGHRALLIDGRGNVIRNNRIVVDGFTAIVAQGPGVVIEDNLIEVRGNLRGYTDHQRRAEAAAPFAIRLIQADGAVVRNNRIRVAGGAAPAAPVMAAIGLVASQGVAVVDNRVDGFTALVHADPASSHDAARNSLQPCPSGALRHLPPGEGGSVPASASVCR